MTLGVRQGSPTSCLLFIIFVNDLINMLKEGAGVYVQWPPNVVAVLAERF